MPQRHFLGDQLLRALRNLLATRRRQFGDDLIEVFHRFFSRLAELEVRNMRREPTIRKEAIENIRDYNVKIIWYKLALIAVSVLRGEL